MASQQITQIITDAAAAAGIPVSLALAQAQKESSSNPNAFNAKSGATGLFQLEPGTASDYGVTDPTDAQQNAEGGLSYLSDLFDRFGNWAEALAAYDWGPTNVNDAIAAHGSSWLAYAPAETQNYVASLLPYANSGTNSGAGGPSLSDFSPALLDAGDSADILTATPSSGSTVLWVAAAAIGVWIGVGLLERAFA